MKLSDIPRTVSIPVVVLVLIIAAVILFSRDTQEQDTAEIIDLVPVPVVPN